MLSVAAIDKKTKYFKSKVAQKSIGRKVMHMRAVLYLCISTQLGP